MDRAVSTNEQMLKIQLDQIKRNLDRMFEQERLLMVALPGDLMYGGCLDVMRVQYGGMLRAMADLQLTIARLEEENKVK